MKTYTIKGFKRYTAYEKVWIQVEAESEEEALRIAKENPEEYEVDSKILDCVDEEYIDKDEWEI
jgi:hypothetical protein